MTKKYILSIAIVLGFFGSVEASDNEDLEYGRKETKGVIFYENGEQKPENKKYHKKISFKSSAKSPSIPINRELSKLRDKSPQNIQKHEVDSSSTIRKEEKFSSEKNSKTKISSISKSPIIHLKNANESTSITNAFTVGSPPRRTYKSSIEENKSMLLKENLSGTPKKEKNFLKKKSSEKDKPLVFQFDFEEDETQGNATVSGSILEITDSDSESFENEKQKKFQNLGSDDEN